MGLRLRADCEPGLGTSTLIRSSGQTPPSPTRGGVCITPSVELSRPQLDAAALPFSPPSWLNVEQKTLRRFDVFTQDVLDSHSHLYRITEFLYHGETDFGARNYEWEHLFFSGPFRLIEKPIMTNKGEEFYNRFILHIHWLLSNLNYRQALDYIRWVAGTISRGLSTKLENAWFRLTPGETEFSPDSRVLRSVYQSTI